MASEPGTGAALGKREPVEIQSWAGGWRAEDTPSPGTPTAGPALGPNSLLNSCPVHERWMFSPGHPLRPLQVGSALPVSQVWTARPRLEMSLMFQPGDGDGPGGAAGLPP